MTSPPEPALSSAPGPDRGVHCGTVLLEPARATYSKAVAYICASNSTFIRSFHVSLHVQIHGSLEGVGGLKTNEAYHSKADALLIPEM